MAKLWVISCVLLALTVVVIRADSDDSSMEDSYEDLQMDGVLDSYSSKDEAYLMAEYCDPEVCVPPGCRCASTVLTEKIPVEEIPQVIYAFFTREEYIIILFYIPCS